MLYHICCTPKTPRLKQRYYFSYDTIVYIPLLGTKEDTRTGIQMAAIFI